MPEDDTLISLTAQTALTDPAVTGASPLGLPTGPTSTGVTGAAPSDLGAAPTVSGIPAPAAPSTVPSTVTPTSPTDTLPGTTTPVQTPVMTPSPVQTPPSGTQAANQFLIGTPSDTILASSDGNDLLIAPATTAAGTSATLQGNAGNDTLIGRSGNDMLQGGPGDDMLFGGLSANQLSGGPGQDLFVFEGGSDTIQDFTPAEGDRIRIAGQQAMASTLIDSAIATPDGALLVPQTGGSLTLLGLSPQQLSTDWFTSTP